MFEEITLEKLEGLQKASVPPVGPDAGEDLSKKPATHLENARAYQQEHNCSMTEALKITADKRQK